MKVGMKVEGLTKAVEGIRLRSVAAGSKGKLKAVVGYKTPYALHVHENLEVHHPVGKAKYLTGPERRIRPKMVALVKAGLIAGKTPRAALWAAAQMLVAESQKEVPVDTGRLKQSVYIAVVGSDK